MMELLILVCSDTLQIEVDQMLEELKIAGYTHVPQAVGSGIGGGIRLNDEVWPGSNSLYMISANPQQTAEIKSRVRKYRTEPLREGMKLFTLPLIEVI
ncbi:MAG: hypothetical protein PHD82_08940 [Candidatus Riflebacteria bacterium]|nr:hypothetical protein [Candidatus Riflebacteria bacterium]